MRPDSYVVGVIGVAAGIVVGLTLVVAGVLKLVEGPAWLKQAADMDVPRALAQLVPLVELAIGAPLALRVMRPWPAVAALIVLMAFTVVIVRRLLDGSRPPCACFGSRSKRPLGVVHVVRNAALIVGAGVAIAFA